MFGVELGVEGRIGGVGGSVGHAATVAGGTNGLAQVDGELG